MLCIDTMTPSIDIGKIAKICSVMKKKISINIPIFPSWKLMISILIAGKVQDNSLNPKINLADLCNLKYKLLLKSVNNLL